MPGRLCESFVLAETSLQVTYRGIISDIDDTIKITQTVDPLGILKTTFAEEPKTTSGMPEFYKILNEQFQNPAWFYLSASPYNLYPFLHKFINDKYLPGTIILRDSSWMYLGGMLQGLTQGVGPYKVDRMNKIHSWLPERKMVSYLSLIIYNSAS